MTETTTAPTTFSHEVLRTGSCEAADKAVTALTNAFGSSYYAPRFGAAPAGGEFSVFVQSDDDRAADELLPALLSAVVFELAFHS